MSDDVILAKVATVERCVLRAREERAAAVDFAMDFTRQDAAILNIERACEAAIDIAFRLVRLRGLGVATSNREAFDLLTKSGVIEPALAGRLKRMVGFRNMATHRYRELDLAIVDAVIASGLDDILAFTTIALRV